MAGVGTLGTRELMLKSVCHVLAAGSDTFSAASWDATATHGNTFVSAVANGSLSRHTGATRQMPIGGVTRPRGGCFAWGDVSRSPSEPRCARVRYED